MTADFPVRMQPSAGSIEGFSQFPANHSRDVPHRHEDSVIMATSTGGNSKRRIGFALAAQETWDELRLS
ncbi:hypothetical protein [Roseiconus nitratireducens]|uniref:hypothetical protein n=1 Tax=Roseiconus nitratireducens TaxID=2605748 RepID=UPI001375F36E|nr:hypothetical protein [Roseiconus nitratireducens]